MKRRGSGLIPAQRDGKGSGGKSGSGRGSGNGGPGTSIGGRNQCRECGGVNICYPDCPTRQR